MVTENDIRVLLHALGMQDNDELVEHFGTMVEALQIYEDRTPIHGQLWKEYGASDTAFHLKSKALRVVSDPAQHIDDALDAINYAVFTIRNVREGRFDGA